MTGHPIDDEPRDEIVDQQVQAVSAAADAPVEVPGPPDEATLDRLDEPS